MQNNKKVHFDPVIIDMDFVFKELLKKQLSTSFIV